MGSPANSRQEGRCAWKWGDIYALFETQVCLLEVLYMNRKRLLRITANLEVTPHQRDKEEETPNTQPPISELPRGSGSGSSSATGATRRQGLKVPSLSFATKGKQ